MGDKGTGLLTPFEVSTTPSPCHTLVTIDGVLTNYRSRLKDFNLFSASNRLEIEQLSELTNEYLDEYTL
jgi:hypothetical protein